jgi:hypothetical protein
VRRKHLKPLYRNIRSRKDFEKKILEEGLGSSEAGIDDDELYNYREYLKSKLNK